jgi:hypothetical protein
VRFFFARRIPPLERVLLVESGARELYETLLPGLYQHCPKIDLVTCFAGAPSAFRSDQGAVFRVSDYPDKPRRKRLYSELRSRKYSALGIICADQPVMTKWKWALAAQIPAKLFILNENGDYFWVDYSNWRIMRHFIAVRAGLSGADAAKTLGQMLALPFTVLFLVLYTAYAHLRRRWHRAFTRGFSSRIAAR